jgi:hypothetical protein
VENMPESGYSVYRINYEIEGDTKMAEWTCFIGAASHEEAVNHLVKTLNKNIKINTSGMQCRLDDVSMSIRSSVVKRYLIETGHFRGSAGMPANESKLEETAIEEQLEEKFSEKAKSIVKKK